MKKIGFIVQFLCLALFSFGQSAGDGIRFIEGREMGKYLENGSRAGQIYLMDAVPLGVARARL